MPMLDPEITPELLKTIDILEGLESLLDQAPTPAIADVLQEAWLNVTRTFPEDFQEATREDAGSEGLRRYVRIKAFFSDPIQNPITPQELEDYYQNRLPLPEDLLMDREEDAE